MEDGIQMAIFYIKIFFEDETLSFLRLVINTIHIGTLIWSTFLSDPNIENFLTKRSDSIWFRLAVIISFYYAGEWANYSAWNAKWNGNLFEVILIKLLFYLNLYV